MATSRDLGTSSCDDQYPTDLYEDSIMSRRTDETTEWGCCPDIPVDIAQLIFEKAMEDAPLPVHLALVSRQVQRWVEPFIYQHLVFRNAREFALFYRTFRNRRYSPTKSTSFFAKHVKTLHVLNRAAPRMEQMIAIGRTLKSLRAASGWDNSWGCLILGFLAFDCVGTHSVRVIGVGIGWRFSVREEREMWRDDAEERRRAGTEDNLLEGWIGQKTEEDERRNVLGRMPRTNEGDSVDRFTYKDLRRLSISAHALRLFRINFTHRIFRDLTHLDIYYCRLYDWSTLSTIKTLTHIAIDFLTLVNLNFVEMKLSMEEIINFCQALPHMKAIIFACINGWNKDFDLMDDNHDMLSPLNFSAEIWDDCGPLIETTCDEYHLHYFTQLCLGIPDPRVVLGVVTEGLPSNHLMKDYMVDFVWPKNSHDWDFTVPTERHRESWDVAEEIIERRQKERRERRRKAGKPLVSGDQGQRVEGEFGFGDLVVKRWDQRAELSFTKSSTC